ncbi:hypothetical protein GCM10027452_05420 [Micromonospora halotolerans]
MHQAHARYPTSPTTKTRSDSHRNRAEVMAALRNAAIGALRAAGIANTAAANRHHACDSTRPLALVGIT